MAKVIVSKETCRSCHYGTTGVCDMYEEIARPCDGDSCYNYEKADNYGYLRVGETVHVPRHAKTGAPCGRV